MTKQELSKNGYTESHGIFQKKICIGNVLRVIVISETPDGYCREESFYKKGDELPFDIVPAVYNKNLKELVI